VNIDSILVSKFADVEDGPLTVVGAFQVVESSRFPLKLPMLAISLVLHGHVEEARDSHRIRVEVLNEKRETVNPRPIEGTFRFSDHGIPGLPLEHVAVFRILHPVFRKPGAYAVEVYVDDTYHAGAAFYAAKVARR